MDIAAIYQFLFESIDGIWLLLGVVLVISLILAIIGEVNLKKRYVDRGFKDPEDDWNNPNYGKDIDDTEDEADEDTEDDSDEEDD